MSQAFGQEVLEVGLPNGRAPNICTREGALEFITFAPNWATDIMSAVRASLVNYDPEAHDPARILFEIPKALNGKHADKLPGSEIKAVVEFYEDLFTNLATTKWKETGILEGRELAILSGIVAWCHYPVFVREMLPRGFPGLAALLELARCFPEPFLARNVLQAVHNAHYMLANLTAEEATPLSMMEHLDAPAFSLEATGIVAQAMRLFLTPALNTNTFLHGFLAGILCEDSQLLLERFAPGKPSADFLKGLVDGTDPWLVVSRQKEEDTQQDKTLILEKFKILLDLGLGKVGPSLFSWKTTSCRNCNTYSDKLMKCGRCKGANYCSRECQKADWKKHKKVCTTPSTHESGAQISTSLNPEIMIWFEKHSKEIRCELDRMQHALCLSPQDLVIEIDLQASSDPAVLIKPFSVYVVGDEAGPGMPHWGDCRNDKRFVCGLKDARSRCHDKNILLVHRSIDADYGICRSTVDF